MTKSIPLDASSLFAWENEPYWDRDSIDPRPPYFENPMDYALTFCDEDFAIFLLNSPDAESYMADWNLECAEFIAAYMPKFYAAIEERSLYRAVEMESDAAPTRKRL